MSLRSSFSFTLTLVMCLSTLITPAESFAQFRGYGSRSSSRSGSSGSSHWSTGQKVAVVGGLALGGYLVYRSFRAAQNRQVQRQANSVSRNGVRYYESSDDEGYDSSDSEYNAYRNRLSAAELKAQVEKEYSAYKRRNAETFTAARSHLGDLMSAIQAKQNPTIVCAAVCAGWTGFKLSAAPVSVGADTLEEGSASLTRQCKSLGGSLTDGLNPNKEGSASISLTTPSNVCMLNQFSANTMQTIEGQDVAISVRLLDISFVEDGTPISKSFRMNTLKEINDQLNLVTQFKTERATLNELKKQKDLLDQMGSFKLISEDPVHGLRVMSNQKSSDRERMTVKIHTIKEGINQIEGESPDETDHECGEEWHRVKLTYELNSTGHPVPAKVSPAVLNLTLESTTYQGEDDFCIAPKP